MITSKYKLRNLIQFFKTTIYRCYNIPILTFHFLFSDVVSLSLSTFVYVHVYIGYMIITKEKKTRKIHKM